MRDEGHILPNGGSIQYTGSLANSTFVMMLGRNDFLKDEPLVQSLVASLASETVTIGCYEHEGTVVAKQINRSCDDFYAKHPRISRRFQNILKMLLLLRYPRAWAYFFLAKTNNPHLISYQIHQLRSALKSFDADREVFLLTRSASGRTAAHVADVSAVKKIVCLGYPFKHPDASDEQERVRPLVSVAKPYLIIQGIHDVYGGQEVLDRYTFSPKVSISFVETDHNFCVSQNVWENVIKQIKTFYGMS